MTNEDPGIKGLTAKKFLLGQKSLIIRPAIVVFPKRCLFTNEPTEGLTEMTLHEMMAKRTGTRISERMRQVALPVSPAWIERQTKSKKMVGTGLLIAGIVIIVAIVIVALLPASLVPTEIKMPVCGMAGGVGVILTIVGLFWSRIKGKHSDPRAIGAWFMTSPAGEESIRIDGAHPDFLAQLPAEA